MSQQINTVTLGDRLKCWGWGLRSKRHGKAVTYGFSDATGMPWAKEAGIPHGFSTMGRAWRYKHGFAKLGRLLANDYMLDAVGLKDGDAILDIGANNGDLALSLKLYGNTFDITAIEPSPSEFQCMEANYRAQFPDSDPTFGMYGLWNEEGEALKFYLSSSSADSSLIEPVEYSGTIDVPVKRLDSMIGDKQFKLMKLEAEGAEPEILEGAGERLRQFEWISADCGFERGVKAESTLPQVSGILHKHGFEMVSVRNKRFVVLFKRV